MLKSRWRWLGTWFLKISWSKIYFGERLLSQCLFATFVTVIRKLLKKIGSNEKQNYVCRSFCHAEKKNQRVIQQCVIWGIRNIYLEDNKAYRCYQDGKKTNNTNATGSCKTNIKEDHNSLDTGLKLNVHMKS